MSAGRIALAASVVVVLGSVIAALFLIGSPARQRDLRTDETRISDLRSLSNALARYYRETRQLPDSIEQVMDGRIMSRLPRDPASGAAYEYERTGTARYRLCGDFARAGDTGEAEDFWAHPAGRQCFEFDYSAIRLD